MSYYKLVIFDLDGTLLDTIDDIENSVNLTMKEFGYPTHSREMVCSFINDGSFKCIQRSLPNGKNDEENTKIVHKKYLEIYDENFCVRTKAYDGIVEMIQRLKEDGVLMAVVSNKPEKYVKILLESIYGKDTFVYMSGTGEGLPTKPSRECCDRVIQKIQVPSEKILFVGDSHVDVTTAHNAQLECAGVMWGFHGENGFLDKIPDYYIYNTEQLYLLIKNGKETAQK